MIDVGVRQTQSTDAQIHVADWVEAALQRFADNGSFPSRKYNQLKDGIWELKHYKLRIAFFDTPGDGTYSPKINWEGQTHWNPPTLPEFDPIIRLALGFPKPPDNFVEHHIERARMIREEDVQHDLDV